jgi:hypothetical protein
MALLAPPGEQPPAPPPAAPGPADSTATPSPPAPAARIAWQDWNDATFAQASEQNRPLFLLVDAPWSRSATWIEEKVLKDPEVVSLVQELFIPVRVQRDRRPDIDLRYQIAVSVVTKGDSGWPLMIMLAPNGEILYGSSYLALEDRPGKPGLRSLLRGTARLYSRNPQASDGSRRVITMAFERERQQVRPRQVTAEIITEAAAALVASYAGEHGGFGRAPRVPAPYALELAGTLFHRSGKHTYKDMLLGTLRAMERGALYDRVGGGIHRSTSDDAWRYPEFEKLLTYNATFLMNCLMAIEVADEPDLKEAAVRTLGYMLDTLADPQGGFAVAQHAAAQADEPKGSYYTWSREELEAIIPAAHQPLAWKLFHVPAEGDLVLGPPPRGVLFQALTRPGAAAQLGTTEAEVRAGESAILAALRGAQAKRTPPPVDRSIYVDSSSLAVVAMMEAWRVLGSEPARQAGLAALDRMLAMVPPDGSLRHRVHPPPDPSYDPPLALDHVMLAWASLAAFDQTGQGRYLAAASDLMQRAHALFWDAEDGGLFDVAAQPAAPGYLNVRRRLINDIAYPALNSLAARVMDRLAELTGDATFRARAEQCLGQLVSTMKKVEYFHAGLALAVEFHLKPPVWYVVVGSREDAAARDLASAAQKVFNPGRIFRWLDPEADEAELARLKIRKGRAPYLVVCEDRRCGEPVRDPAAVRR